MDESERKDLERRIRAKALSKARAALAFRWHLQGPAIDEDAIEAEVRRQLTQRSPSAGR